MFSYICVLVLIALCLPVARAAGENQLALWYKAPAANWNEALPVGNGRLGAMVFGDPYAEHFQLNENTVWSGQRHYNPSEMKQNLPAVRKLLFEGKYKEAEELAEKTMTTKPKDPRYGNYQPPKETATAVVENDQLVLSGRKCYRTACKGLV